MKQKITLKRDLGFTLLVFYGLGNILGAGIYVLVGKVVEIAGYYAPFAFVISAVVAYFTALSYAELSARYPYSAGEALYVYKGFHSQHLSLIVGLLVCLSATVSAATITHGFVGYLQVFFNIPDVLGIVLITLILGFVASMGIAQAVGAAAILTVIEILGLLLIIATGVINIENLETFTTGISTSLTLSTVITIFAGAFVAFYAFLGFEDMVNVAEEVKNPSQQMPKAILVSLFVATSFYFLIALVATTAVDPARLGQSKAPLALVYQELTGDSPIVITLISLFAVINGALIQIIMISRLLYGMSKQNWLPAFLSKLNKKTSTPVNATMLTTLAVLTAALTFPLITLAKFTSLFILILFVIVNAALLNIKRHAPEIVGVKSYSPLIPVLGILTSALLIVMEIIG